MEELTVCFLASTLITNTLIFYPNIPFLILFSGVAGIHGKDLQSAGSFLCISIHEVLSTI